ncbi:MAG: heavy-metal-associated domain-containing protein [Niabella sp.]
MKFQVLSTLFVFLFSMMFANAQNKTEEISVSGNCGMCKSNIEKAAKKAGAASADWNKDTKILTVQYDSKKTNSNKIQKSISAVGYDTQDFKGNDEAYNKLHTCCKYDRTKTYESQSTKNKGGDDAACCDKSDKQCCKDKKAGKSTCDKTKSKG